MSVALRTMPRMAAKWASRTLPRIMAPKIQETNVLKVAKSAFEKQLIKEGRMISPASGLLFFEKFSNGIAARANNPLATYTEVFPEYQPNAAKLLFSLPVFSLPRSECQVLVANDHDPAILAKYVSEDSVQFPVHPQVAQDTNVLSVTKMQESPQSKLTVSATASSRTVLALDPDNANPYCVKLHFPYQITRSVRHLEKRKIEHSIRLTNDLASSKALAVKNKQFAFLPESLGVVFGNTRDSWGFLIRELTPRPFVPGNRQLVPLFSLYSPNKLCPEAPPFLVELVKNADMDPEAFILEKVLFPILKCWVDVFLETGILIEAHGQNTCLELDENGIPTRIVFRDLDTHVNKEIRQKKGLSLEGINPYEMFSQNDPEEDGSHMSLLYDQAMKAAFDRLAAAASKYFGVSEKSLQKQCRKYLREVFPEGDLFFPRGPYTYNYTAAPLAVGAKAQLEKIDQAPVWR